MKKLVILHLLLASGCHYVPATTKVVTATTVITPGFSSALSVEQWSSVIAAAAAIIALGVTAWQIRENTKATNIQTLSGLYTRLAGINTLLIEHEAIAPKLETAFIAEADLNSPASSYIDTVRSFFHEMYLYHQKGLVDLPEWESWKETMKDFCTQPYFKGYWSYRRGSYSSGFQGLIDNWIRESNTQKLVYPRALSFTDAEYEKLSELAIAAQLGCSEYVIDRLGLDK
jgi:hypothetical protein